MQTTVLRAATAIPSSEDERVGYEAEDEERSRSKALLAVGDLIHAGSANVVESSPTPPPVSFQAFAFDFAPGDVIVTTRADYRIKISISQMQQTFGVRVVARRRSERGRRRSRSVRRVARELRVPAGARHLG